MTPKQITVPIVLNWKSDEGNATVLYCQKLSDRAKIPKQATPNSIGLDLFAPVEFPVPPDEQVCIPTDLMLVPSSGYYIRIASKSGLAVKHKLTVEAGEIDPDYRGNIVVVLRNHHKKKGYLFEEGEAIAQIILTKTAVPQIIETVIAVDTERGIKGFGSTQ